MNTWSIFATKSLVLASLVVLGGCDESAPMSVAEHDQAVVVRDLATGDSDIDTAADNDEDGLADSYELELARRYLPYLSLSSTDACPTGGLLVRVSPHPGDPTLVHIVYDYLYDADCGIQGHAGDDEVFAATIDPNLPAPGGIIAMKAISHQGTICERDSACGRCGGLSACQTLPLAGTPWPAVWSSKNKHGSYLNSSTSCSFGATCLDQCDDNSQPSVPPIVNAGEPGHPLVHDLTDAGFITLANGWKNMALFHYDPWKPGKFGGAGDISLDLVDASFDTIACHP